MKSRVAIILASECLRPEIVMLLLRSLHSSRSCQYSQLINCEKFKINSKFLAKHHAQNMKLLHLCKDHDHQFNLAVTSSFLPKHSQLISLKKDNTSAGASSITLMVREIITSLICLSSAFRYFCN